MMSARDSAEAGELPASDVDALVDDAADDFEAAWQTGRQLRIEDVLADVPAAARVPVLRELVAIDAEWRRRSGETVGPDDYAERFPELAGELESLMASLSGSSPVRDAVDPAVVQQAESAVLAAALAVQGGLADPDAVLTALEAWVATKDAAFEELLRSRGVLTDVGSALLAGLLAHRLSAQDSPGEALTSIALPDAFRRKLASISDTAVQAAAARLAASAEMKPRYRILGPHKSGRMGSVFRAWDEEVGRDVAIKRIRDPHADNPGLRARFLLEAEVTGRLQHPGVAPLFGLGTDPETGRPFYAMRFVEGETLEEAITRFHGPDGPTKAAERNLAQRQLLTRFVALCETIQYAHERGVLHRDIKPANVVLGAHGETIVLDWGLAKIADRPDAAAAADPVLRPSAIAKTVPGSTVGSPAYASPEQARGDLAAIGPASDVYGLGATLSTCCRGSYPSVAATLLKYLPRSLLGKDGHCERSGPRHRRNSMPSVRKQWPCGRKIATPPQGNLAARLNAYLPMNPSTRSRNPHSTNPDAWQDDTAERCVQSRRHS